MRSIEIQKHMFKCNTKSAEITKRLKENVIRISNEIWNYHKSTYNFGVGKRHLLQIKMFDWVHKTNYKLRGILTYILRIGCCRFQLALNDKIYPACIPILRCQLMQLFHSETMCKYGRRGDYSWIARLPVKRIHPLIQSVQKNSPLAFRIVARMC